MIITNCIYLVAVYTYDIIIESDSDDNRTKVLYIGDDRGAALEEYNNFSRNKLYIINAPKAELFMAGYAKQTEKGVILDQYKSIFDKVDSPKKHELLAKKIKADKLLENDGTAREFYQTVSNPNRTAIAALCETCGANITVVLNKNVTIFGKNLCDSCWETYLHTEKGLLEYVVAIALGKYSVSHFTEAEREAFVASWKNNRDALLEVIPNVKLKLIEALAREAGLTELTSPEVAE